MLIDSHCHIPHKKYNKSVDEILIDCRSNDVDRLIAIGTSIKENMIAVQTAISHKEIYCTVGIYPHEDKKKELPELESALRNLIETNKGVVVGVGECGVDITEWQNGRSIAEQLDLFKMQVQVASDYSLPLCIHNRNGTDFILEVLRNPHLSKKRGVIHCFSDSWEDAKQFLDLGFYISFSGMLTYPSSKHLIEVAQKVPLDKFLVETDSPYLPPQGHRGETNFPKYVRIVAEKVAQLKQIPLEEIEKLTYENTCRLYNILC